LFFNLEARKTMRNALTALLTGAALVGAAGSASAATATANFTVQATVLKTCSATATNLNLGSYTPGAGALGTTANPITSTVSVLCTNGTTYTVGLNAGTTTGGAVTQRLLAETGGTGTLQYNLYTTAAQGTIWGDGTGGTVTQAGTGTGMAAADAKAFLVYGNLPDNTNNQAAPIPAGLASVVYSDTITVTVTY
jgi:spore coat protein U-like protein